MISGLRGMPHGPVYCASKWAIIGLLKSWGVGSRAYRLHGYVLTRANIAFYTFNVE